MARDPGKRACEIATPSTRAGGVNQPRRGVCMLQHRLQREHAAAAGRQSVVGVAVVVGFIGFLFLLLLLFSSEQLPRRRVLARLGQGGGKWSLICHISTPFPPYSTLLGADRAG